MKRVSHAVKWNASVEESIKSERIGLNEETIRQHKTIWKSLVCSFPTQQLIVHRKTEILKHPKFSLNRHFQRDFPRHPVALVRPDYKPQYRVDRSESRQFVNRNQGLERFRWSLSPQHVPYTVWRFTGTQSDQLLVRVERPSRSKRKTQLSTNTLKSSAAKFASNRNYIPSDETGSTDTN